MRFAIFALLFTLIISLASAEEFEQFDKRNSCSSYKRDVLGKRNYKKCPCAVADTSFDNNLGFSGFMALTQDACGRVLVIGQFFAGFPPGVNHTFAIVDYCGKVLADLGDLGVQPNGSGGTEPISESFTSFNLNCDSNGIQFAGSNSYYKRNCYSKRQGAGASMQINTPGNTPARSAIRYPKA